MDLNSKGIPVTKKDGPPPKKYLPVNLEPEDEAGQPGAQDDLESET